jgi:putative PIN family toxin of toxin-antitoxin system
MITAVLDTNVVLQSLIGSPSCASARTLNALFDEEFSTAYSPAVLDEWLQVLSMPTMRERHGLDDDELLEFLAAVIVSGTWYPGVSRVSAALTRDMTDTKFLALSAESRAQFLISNDHRHLLPLRRFKSTRIIKPAQFLAEIRKK